MRICICDDDKSMCDNLKEMILQHGAHAITVFHSAEELLFECENQFPFDLVFLDIQMKSINGIECAHKIREYDKKIGIVFLSAIKDYVFEGYEVSAIRYLLKPLETQKCHELLDLIIESVMKERQYLLVNKTKVDCEKILFIESFGHYCAVHTDEVIETKVSLSEMSAKLPVHFVQTHRSYIVNLEHVDSVLKDVCLLDDGSEIPISRNSVKKVNRAFMEFIKGGLM